MTDRGHRPRPAAAALDQGAAVLALAAEARDLKGLSPADMVAAAHATIAEDLRPLAEKARRRDEILDRANRKRKALNRAKAQRVKDAVRGLDRDADGARPSDREIQQVLLAAKVPIARGGHGLKVIAELRRPRRGKRRVVPGT